jgi:ribosomal protein S12 methylthiotransferase accessory factor
VESSVRAPTAGPAPAIRFRERALRSAKGFLHSSHRACAPAETLERIRPYLAAAQVTRVADITGLDRIGIPVTLPVRPNSRTLATAAGKGLDLESSMVSGAMESLELHAAEWADLPVREGTEESLRREGHDVLALADLQLMHRVPTPTPLTQHAWVPGWDVLRQVEVLSPVAAVHMATFQQWPHLKLLGYVAAGSNGLASGNTLLEAICAALYEVLERDAIACAMAAGGGLAVGDALLGDDRIADLLARLTAAGLHLELEDCTWDTEVPTFQAFIYDLEHARVAATRGEGSHLDPRIAIIRAVTEAVQARAIIIAGSRDEILRRQQDMSRFYRPVPGDRRRPRYTDSATAPAPARPSLAAGSFEEDVAHLLGRLRAVGIERVVVHDLTPPGWEIAVARVVVPGLEGYHFDHYARGPRAQRAAARAAALAA